MAAVEFDINGFRAAYPAFAQTDPVALNMYWSTAGIYINPNIYNCTNVTLLTQYLNLMTAHLAALSCLIAAGEAPGFVTSATVDKVTVAIQPPPETNQFQWWLNLTPYGQQLLALLQVQAVGGFYAGGLPELSAFRKVYGVF
jgi:hypothetical protein